MYVFSDNVRVSSFQQLKVGNFRQRRMLCYLQQFNLHLFYLKGKIHCADYLSRSADDLTAAEKVDWKVNDDDDLDNFLFNITSSSDKMMEGQGRVETEERPWTLHVIKKGAEGSESSALSVNQIEAKGSDRTAKEGEQSQMSGDQSSSGQLNANAVPFYPSTWGWEKICRAEKVLKDNQSILMAENQKCIDGASFNENLQMPEYEANFHQMGDIAAVNAVVDSDLNETVQQSENAQQLIEE